MALDEDENVIMGHFIDGLNDQIDQKVEHQPCHDLNEKESGWCQPMKAQSMDFTSS